MGRIALEIALQLPAPARARGRRSRRRNDPCRCSGSRQPPSRSTARPSRARPRFRRSGMSARAICAVRENVPADARSRSRRPVRRKRDDRHRACGRTLGILFRQPVDQVDADRAEAGRARRVDHARGFRATLWMRLTAACTAGSKSCTPNEMRLKPSAASPRTSPASAVARIDLDAELASGIAAESRNGGRATRSARASARRQEIRRAAAEVHLTPGRSRQTSGASARSRGTACSDSCALPRSRVMTRVQPQ